LIITIGPLALPSLLSLADQAVALELADLAAVELDVVVDGRVG